MYYINHKPSAANCGFSYVDGDTRMVIVFAKQVIEEGQELFASYSEEALEYVSQPQVAR